MNRSTVRKMIKKKTTFDYVGRMIKGVSLSSFYAKMSGQIPLTSSDIDKIEMILFNVSDPIVCNSKISIACKKLVNEINCVRKLKEIAILMNISYRDLIRKRNDLLKFNSSDLVKLKEIKKDICVKK